MTEPCRHEPHVCRAVLHDQWTDALREHVTICADCAAAAAAAPFMKRLSTLDERQQKLPDSSLLWLKAQLLRGSTVADRVTRPLNIAQMAAYGIVAAGWASVLTWRWPDLQRWLLGFTPANMVQNVANSTSLPASFVLIIAILASMTVMLAVHTILAED